MASLLGSDGGVCRIVCAAQECDRVACEGQLLCNEHATSQLPSQYAKGGRLSATKKEINTSSWLLRKSGDRIERLSRMLETSKRKEAPLSRQPKRRRTAQHRRRVSVVQLLHSDPCPGRPQGQLADVAETPVLLCEVDNCGLKAEYGNSKAGPRWCAEHGRFIMDYLKTLREERVKHKDLLQNKYFPALPLSQSEGSKLTDSKSCEGSSTPTNQSNMALPNILRNSRDGESHSSPAGSSSSSEPASVFRMGIPDDQLPGEREELIQHFKLREVKFLDKVLEQSAAASASISQLERGYVSRVRKIEQAVRARNVQVEQEMAHVREATRRKSAQYAAALEEASHRSAEGIRRELQEEKMASEELARAVKHLRDREQTLLNQIAIENERKQEQEIEWKKQEAEWRKKIFALEEEVRKLKDAVNASP